MLWSESVSDGLRLRVVRAVALGVLALGSGLSLAALAAWLIARAWQMPPVLDLGVAVVTVRALGISRGLGRYLERLATHDVALRRMAAARVEVYRGLAAADAATIAGLRRGDVLTAIGADIDALGAVLVRATVPIAVAVVLSLIAVAMLAGISLVGAAMLAAALAVAGILGPVLAHRAARDAEHAAHGHRAECTANVVAALDHAAELRVAGRLEAVLTAADVANGDAVRAEDRAAAKGAFAPAVIPLAIGATVIGCLLVAIHAQLSPMALAVLVLVPLSAFEAVAALPAAAQALNHAHGSRRDTRTTVGDDGQARWIDRPEGRRVAIVGPSGVGKTRTLMAWADSDADALFFAEDAHVFDTTVLENLRVARGDLVEPDAIAALRAVGLGNWLDGLPEGVHTHLVGGAAAVSGGQRRRLLLARALVSPADVLLLDEPTEHLDAAQGAQLLCELLDADSGLVDPDRTVVVVTHQLPAEHRADIVMDFSHANNPLHRLPVGT